MAPVIKSRSFFGFLAFFVALFVGVVPVSFAGTPAPDQQTAYSWCQGDAYVRNDKGGVCKLYGVVQSVSANSYCPSGKGVLYYRHYGVYWNGQDDMNNQYSWCVPLTCQAVGTLQPQSFPGPSADGKAFCPDGCLWIYKQTSVITWVAGGEYNTGNLVSQGTLCTTVVASTDASAGAQPPKITPPPQPPICNPGELSCYNPNLGYCGSTESGEFVCTQPSVPPSSAPPAPACASGATGSVCLGGAPPPDPPVPPGAPNRESDFGVNNTGGGGGSYTVVQVTYSGTSPGPAPTSGGTASGTAGQSNSTGSGNSGPNGTSPATTSSTGGSDGGKCPDGSVPTASGCSGTYRDNGCDTPPACFGDAVLCGIAVNTKETQCAVQAASGSSVGSVPNEGDPMDASGDPSSSSVSSSTDLGAASSSLDASGFGFSASCPLLTPISFDVLGQHVSVDVSQICTPLGYIYFIVLGFAYFLSVKIISGVK